MADPRPAARQNGPRPPWPVLLPLILVLVAIAGAGYGYYLEQRYLLRRAAGEQIAAVADLKAEEIGRWIADRRRDAATLYYGRIEPELEGFLTQSAAAPHLIDGIERWLANLARSFQYRRVVLAGATGRPLASHPRGAVSSLPEALVDEARSSRRVVFTDLSGAPGPSIELVVPLLGTRLPRAEPLGVLVLEVDPEVALFPMLRTWPTRTRTAETLLLSRDGGELEMLNPRRLSENAAARPPLDPEPPAAGPGSDPEEAMRTRDYRGVDVLAALRPIPESAWAVAAKQDLAEVDEPLFAVRIRTAVLTLLVMAVVALVTLGLWRRQTVEALRSAKQGLEERVRERTSALEQEVVERKQAQRALGISEARFRTALSDAPIAVFNQDRGLRYTWIYDPGAVLPFGGALGRRDAELLGPEQGGSDLEAFKREVLDSGEGARGELALGPEPQYFDLTVEPLWDPDGSLAGITGAAFDVTDRRRLQGKLEQHAAKLMEADRHKDDFLAMLAHELRNPLAPIRNATEILRRETREGSRPRQMSELIGRQVEHIERLVYDLLDVARITRGRIALRKETFDLREAARHATEAVEPFARQRGLEVVTRIPERPLWVHGDRTRIEQVAGNLLHNAAKYTDAGGHIGVALTPEQDDAVMRVHDSGIGMAPELVSQVFDLFVQADRSLDRTRGGLGLGLTLARSLVRLHGGSIEAASPGAGRGSTFTVRLPLASAPQPALAGEAPASGGDGRRVLVVDDHEDEARSLSELLAMLGHETRYALDGHAALAEAERFQPEVVLLDIGLPGMDGYEVARRLRAAHPDGGPLLVAVSGYGQDKDVDEAGQAGFHHHMLKPIDLPRLKALLSATSG